MDLYVGFLKLEGRSISVNIRDGKVLICLFKTNMEQDNFEKFQIIEDFLKYNSIRKNSQVIEFDAIVEYVESSICDVTRIQMKLDNFYWGNIEVYPTNKIDMKKVHTGLYVPYHKYELQNQTLVIRGTSSPEKGGKDFTVKITPR